MVKCILGIVCMAQVAVFASSYAPNGSTEVLVSSKSTPVTGNTYTISYEETAVEYMNDEGDSLTVTILDTTQTTVTNVTCFDADPDECLDVVINAVDSDGDEVYVSGASINLSVDMKFQLGASDRTFYGSGSLDIIALHNLDAGDTYSVGDSFDCTTTIDGEVVLPLTTDDSVPVVATSPTSTAIDDSTYQVELRWVIAADQNGGVFVTCGL